MTPAEEKTTNRVIRSVSSFEPTGNGIAGHPTHRFNRTSAKITSVSENKERWAVMKEIYYGGFDREFMKKIDAKFEVILFSYDYFVEESRVVR